MNGAQNAPKPSTRRSIGSRLRLSRSVNAMSAHYQSASSLAASGSLALNNSRPPLPSKRVPNVPFREVLPHSIARHTDSASTSGSEYSLSAIQIPPACESLPATSNTRGRMVSRDGSPWVGSPHPYALPTLTPEEAFKAQDLLAGLAGVGAHNARADSGDGTTHARLSSFRTVNVDSSSESHSFSGTSNTFSDASNPPSPLLFVDMASGHRPRSRQASNNPLIAGSRDAHAKPAECQDYDVRASVLLEEHLALLQLQQQASHSKAPSRPPTRASRERERTFRPLTPQTDTVAMELGEETPKLARRRSRSVNKIMVQDARRGSRLLHELHQTDSSCSEHEHAATESHKLLAPATRPRARRNSGSALLPDGDPPAALSCVRSKEAVRGLRRRSHSANPATIVLEASRKGQKKDETMPTFKRDANLSLIGPSLTPAARTRANSYCPPTAYAVHASPRTPAATREDSSARQSLGLAPLSELPSLRSDSPSFSQVKADTGTEATASRATTRNDGAAMPSRPPRSARRASALPAAHLVNNALLDGLQVFETQQDDDAQGSHPVSALPQQRENSATLTARFADRLQATPSRAATDNEQNQLVRDRPAPDAMVGPESKRASELPTAEAQPPETSSNFRASAYSIIAVEVESDEETPLPLSEVSKALDELDGQCAQLGVIDSEADGVSWEMVTSNIAEASPQVGEPVFEACEEEFLERCQERMSAVEEWRASAQNFGLDGEPWSTPPQGEIPSVEDPGESISTRSANLSPSSNALYEQDQDEIIECTLAEMQEAVSDHQAKQHHQSWRPGAHGEIAASVTAVQRAELVSTVPSEAVITSVAPLAAVSDTILDRQETSADELTPLPGAFPISGLQEAKSEVGNSKAFLAGLGLLFADVPEALTGAALLAPETIEEIDANSQGSVSNSSDEFESADEGEEHDWRTRRHSRQSKTVSWLEAASSFERKHGCARGANGWRTSVRFSADARRSVLRGDSTSKRMSRALASTTHSPLLSALIEADQSADLQPGEAPFQSACHNEILQLATDRGSSAAMEANHEPSSPPLDCTMDHSEPISTDLDLPPEMQHNGPFVALPGFSKHQEKDPAGARGAHQDNLAVPHDDDEETIGRREGPIRARSALGHGEAYPTGTEQRAARRASRRMSANAMPFARRTSRRDSAGHSLKLAAIISNTPIQLVDTPGGSSWRSSLPARTWSQLLAQFGPKEMHRQEVIWELCSTERSFVQNLASILKVFAVPLRDYQGHWERGTPKLMARIFDWLESILQLHIKISTSFDTARASHATPVILQIAAAVLRHVEALVVHLPYLVRFEEANALLEQILHASDPLPFASFVQDQLRLQECGSMSLGSFLLKPIQRLMKYPLFFKQLLELTPPDHPDYDETCELSQSTEALIRDMNNVKAREEDYSTLLSLEKRIRGLPHGFDLASRYRGLLREGKLRWVQLSDAQRNQVSGDSRASSPRIPKMEGDARPSSSSGFRPLSLAAKHSPTARGSPDLRGSKHSSGDSASGTSVTSSALAHPSRSSTSSDGFFHSPVVGPFNASSYSPGALSSGAGLASRTEKLHVTPLAPPRPMSRKSSVANLFLRASGRSAEKEKARSSESTGIDVHAFVLSDAVILTVQDADVVADAKPTSPLVASGKSKSKEKLRRNSWSAPTIPKEQERFTLISDLGLVRILNVIDRSGRSSDFPNLLEVEVLPIKAERAVLGGPSKHKAIGGPATLFFSFSSDDTPATRRLSQTPELICTAWYRALERSLVACIHSARLSSGSTTVMGTKPQSAHAEWPRRKDQVTRLVMAAAQSGDRENLVALLQSGLPYPRSPSHQDLADRASEVLNKTTSQEGRQSLAVNVRGANSISVVGSSVLDDVEEEREERRWWALRLSEVRNDLNAEKEIDAMIEARAAAFSNLWATGNMSPASNTSPLVGSRDEMTPPRRSVRRGVPILPATTTRQAPLRSAAPYSAVER